MGISPLDGDNSVYLGAKHAFFLLVRRGCDCRTGAHCGNSACDLGTH